MFIQPWDAALDSEEWQNWLATTDQFGVLAVNNIDSARVRHRYGRPPRSVLHSEVIANLDQLGRSQRRPWRRRAH